MGHRANLIIVENKDYVLRYDHWVSHRLDKVLFWGVEYASEYFEAQEIVDENGWLNDVWAEGGAVIDFDRKHLIWYGGEDVSWDVPLRRTYLKLQRKIWKDWTVEWAYRGIVDIAEYVGYPKEKVIAPRLVELNVRSLNSERLDWTDIIGSIKFSEDDSKIYPLPGNIQEYLNNEINIIEQGKNLDGFVNLNWSEISNDSFPEGGFVIDVNQKTVEFWQAKECSDLVNELKTVWEDWDIVWHQDNFEFQIESLQGRLIFPEIDDAKEVKHLRESLLREDCHYNIENVLGITNKLEEEGKSVQINAWAYKNQKVENPLHRKIEIWEKYIGKMN